MASKYDAQLAQARQELAAAEAQEQGAIANLEAAANKVRAYETLLRKDPSTMSDAEVREYALAKNQLPAAIAERDKAQAARERVQADVTEARRRVAGYEAGIAAEKLPENDPNKAVAQRELEQRIRNEKAGKGFKTDATLEAEARVETNRADATQARKDSTAVAREGLEVQREGQRSSTERTLISLEVQKEIAGIKDKYDRDALAVNEKLQQNLIDLKTAELELNQLAKDREIALANIGNELRAATSIDTMNITQRAQDVSLMELGQKSSLSIMDMLMKSIGFMKPGTKVNIQQFLEATGLIQTKVLDFGTKTMQAVPRAEPHPTTTAVAAGERRIGGVEEPVYPEDVAKKKAEIEAQQGTAQTVEEAVDLAIQHSYLEWVEAKQQIGDTTPATFEDFKTHLQQIGREQELTPEEWEQVQTPRADQPAPTEVPPVTPVAPTQAPPPAEAPVAIPAALQPRAQQQPQPVAQQPSGQPIIINVTGQGAPGQGAIDPTGVTQNMQAQANQQIKSQLTDHAALSQTIQMMQEAGYEQDIIDEFAQQHNYDPLLSNPFNDYLNAQLTGT